jgi:amino acid transporter
MPGAPQRDQARRSPAKDSPKIIVLTVLVIAGGLFIYATIFSHLLQDMVLGPRPNPAQVVNFNDGLAHIDICILPITLLGFLALLLYSGEAIFRTTRRAPAPSCPHCGTVESATWRFARQPIQGMGWETVTCPQCHHEWHSRL